LQVALGEAVMPAVPVGGTLVYATCSIDPREDEMVVEHLLHKFPAFSLLDLADWRLRLQDATMGLTHFRQNFFNAPLQRCLRIDPGAETEGFFVAQLVRL
jgi:16S rRNA C967 or C1407 C5-methylase (RsmB/RsmF family)